MVQFNLTQVEKETLLKIARNNLNSLFSKITVKAVDEFEQTPNLNKPCGVFVSLYYQNDLKGCIGIFESNKPLFELISDVTRSAATNDHRFSPIKKDEVDDIIIEISVLTPLEKINDPNEIELGKNGIFIKQGYRKGTFLPQVANKTNWSKEDFFAHCSRDKAGIGWNGWKNSELYKYEAIIINESNFNTKKTS